MTAAGSRSGRLGGRFVFAAVLAVILAHGAPRAARGDIYSWVDENGVSHFTNSPVRGDLTVYLKEEPAAPAQPRTDNALPKDLRYDEAIRAYCASYAVEPALAKAVMKVESDFNPTAKSVKGAMGLMQLMPETAERLGVRNPYDVHDNIQGGIKYLSTLLKQFGSAYLAAAAYNSGENAVTRYGGVPPYGETRKYVKDVIREYESYRKAGLASEGPGAGEAAEPSSTRIYEVTRPDGVVVYTNVPWSYGESSLK